MQSPVDTVTQLLSRLCLVPAAPCQGSIVRQIRLALANGSLANANQIDARSALAPKEDDRDDSLELER